MKLKSVAVKSYKNILSSGDVPIQEDVTCIVGKNESGKTAFLQAVHRLNPAQAGAEFNAQRQYPAWLEKQHRRRMDLDEVVPIEAIFTIEADEIAAAEAEFGKGIITKNELSLSRKYGNGKIFVVHINEAVAINHIAGNLLDKHVSAKPKTLAQLDATLEELAASTGDAAQDAARKEVRTEVKEARDEIIGDNAGLNSAVYFFLKKYIPVFYYFDEYSQLPATVKIKELLSKKKEQLTSAEQTARALLEMAATDNEYLLDSDYETRKRELENVANSITHEVLEYWSTNPELRTDIDITQKQVPIHNGTQSVLDELKIRLYDNRHMLSLSLDERSSGFRWFFSFLAGFSEFEISKNPVIILLDEPGMGLHARAQKDFLRFIDEKLSASCQVIYSTHSPFMVQPGKLERVRLVEDTGREKGSRVTDNVLTTDRDTLFPLQGALGYDIAQHLFVAAHNLVVEGSSDFTYLSLISSHLAAHGRTGLDPRWSIIPVGGVDLIPSFVALLGNHLEVTVLVDSRKEGYQRLKQLSENGLLKETRIVMVGEITNNPAADIEDMFEVSEYLKLFNEAFSLRTKISDLKGSDPIVKRCARVMGVDRYDHGRPATVLLKKHATIIPALSENTLARFESLFTRINATL